LPIVLEIARQHNAEIKLEEARPGQVPPGTRVTLRFVMDEQAVAARAAAAAPTAQDV
jgi:two-component system, OmpR family, sensor histidine kinase TctE